MKFPKNKDVGTEIKSLDEKTVYKFNGNVWDRYKVIENSSTNIVKIADNKFSDIPSGSIDDINFKFELSQTPIKETIQMYVNGIIQRLDEDYTVLDDQIYFVEPPYTDSVISCFYLYQIKSQVCAETVSGFCNGINSTYSLQYTPSVGSDMVFLNGILQRNGDQFDYTVIGNVILFNTAPPIGSTIICNYFTYSL